MVRARQETHGAIRARQNREPDEHQRRFENCNAGWRRVSASSPGKGRRLASLASVPTSRAPTLAPIAQQT